MTPPAGDARTEIEEAAALDAALVGLLAAGHADAAVVTPAWCATARWQRVARVLDAHRRGGGQLGDLLTAARVLDDAGVDFPGTTAAEALLAAHEAVPFAVIRAARERLLRLQARRMARLLDTAALTATGAALADLLDALRLTVEQLTAFARALQTRGAIITPELLCITVNGSLGPRELDGIVPVDAPAVGDTDATEAAATQRAPRDWSPSGFDFTLAVLAVEAGWRDDEITALLGAHARTTGRSPQPATYYARTITRARSSRRLRIAVG